ncbi:hypothetical protein [Frankia sp. QA3]|uniref:hypothetical protein n=1 Tax=Frankia sp. QA3 TaxID=710111 RepID=UPI000269CB55|nr:hypothetical protein [Frankia sp. QA3]EIV95316.1 hypothetical protein FraQA3DRAFT_5126 [Frankia sp. QA3]
MHIASRPSAPPWSDPDPDPDPDREPRPAGLRLGTIIPATALAPADLAGAALLGAPPSWPLLLTWAMVATLLVTAPAVGRARDGRRSRPRARGLAQTPRTRPIPPPTRSGGAAHRFDPAGFEPLADRMALLLRDFLAAAVPRPDRPARLDLRAPATAWFVDAFTAASDLLVATSQADRPATLAAAVREAERRWGLLDAWSRETAGSDRSVHPRPDDPDAIDHDPQPT